MPRRAASMRVPPPARRLCQGGEIDLAAELRTVMHEHEPLATVWQARLEIAAEPDLIVRADSGVLRRVVAEALANAIGHAAGGRVLVAAGRHGGRVQVSILDDGPTIEREEQEANLRDAAQLVALQGGTLDVDVRKGAGTKVVIRLPEPAAPRAEADAPAARPIPSPATKAPAAAVRESRTPLSVAGEVGNTGDALR